jgi:hypothetical protein
MDHYADDLAAVIDALDRPWGFPCSSTNSRKPILGDAGIGIEGTEMETRHSSPADLYEVIAAMRQRREEPPAGGPSAPGHCAWCLLIEDPDLTGKTLAAIGCALDNHDLESAVRLLVIHQYTAVEPWDAAEEAVIEYPALFRHPLTSALRDQILADGFVPVPCDRAGSGEGRRLLWGP